MESIVYLYLAQKGVCSFWVTIGQKGNMALPENVTLEDGTWDIRVVNKVVDIIEVKNGKVIKRSESDGDAPPLRLLITTAVDTSRPPWAHRFETQLAWGEMGHKLQEINNGQEIVSINPQVMRDHVARLTAYLRKKNIVDLLRTLINEEQAEEREKHGYATIEEVKGHLTRVEAFLAYEEPSTLEATP